MTNILVIANYAAAYGGNFLASFAFLANCAEKEGYRPCFIFPEAAADIHWESDLSRYDVRYADFHSQAYDQCVLSMLAEKTIIHTNFLSARELIHLQKLTAGRSGVKLICHEHLRLDKSRDNTGEDNPARRMIMAMKRQGKKIICRHMLRSWTFIGVSPAVYQDLCRWYGARRVYQVLNAISCKRLDADYVPQLPVFDKPVVSIFGTHFLIKGIDIAIRAVAGSRIRNNIYLLVLSHRPDETKQEIFRIFKEIPAFVIVMPPVTDVQEVYHKSFAFLSPSRSEAFGYAVIEAAYAGTRVIASDIPGQNTMRDVPGIYWINCGDTEQLRLSIEDCFEKRMVQSENAAHARAYIKENYSLAGWSKKILQIYNSMFEDG